VAVVTRAASGIGAALADRNLGSDVCATLVSRVAAATHEDRPSEKAYRGMADRTIAARSLRGLLQVAQT
jgi:hypothetical protein